jgi:hypothetical protein
MLDLVVFKLADDSVELLRNALVYDQKSICDVHAILSATPFFMSQMLKQYPHNLLFNLKPLFQT